MQRASLGMLLVVLAFAIGATSCIDPVHSDAVARLGPEKAGVPEGPTHRPGQPCLTCHGGDGPGPSWVAAGTIYQVRGDLSKPLVGGLVDLEDYTGKTYTATTNEVGNFWIEEGQWAPVFPLHVIVYDGARATKATMTSRIGRDGGCGLCHQGAEATRTTMPAVYLKPR